MTTRDHMITGILLGAGQRGEVYASYALKNPSEFRILAVAEPLEERRKEIQRLHHIPDSLAFESWEQLLAMDRFADCVLVCTQDRFHTAPVKKALEKGYHVLCEKPMSPLESECVEMGEYARRYGKTISVCHVLRYSPFYTRLKKILDAGTIGDIVSIQHIESVGYWHQAHSFVRGNWRRKDETSPMILAKCCHDMDILLWLTGEHCQQVSSFGSLKHFRPEFAPEGAAPRCFDGCKVTDTCPYYCGRLYLDREAPGVTELLQKLVALDGSREAVEQNLKTGPYGRCVYYCDNDVVDHQVVNLQLTHGVTVSFTMCAFTGVGSRITNIMGTRGQILGDMEGSWLEIRDFLTDDVTKIQIQTGSSGHSGSDDAFMKGFLRTVATNGAFELSSASMSVESHLVALAAEKSRTEGCTIDMEQYRQALLDQLARKEAE